MEEGATIRTWQCLHLSREEDLPELEGPPGGLLLDGRVLVVRVRIRGVKVGVAPVVLVRLAKESGAQLRTAEEAHEARLHRARRRLVEFLDPADGVRVGAGCLEVDVVADAKSNQKNGRG